MKSPSRSLARKLFPRETWHKHSDGVYVASSRMPRNNAQKAVFNKEIIMAEILARYGHTVYLLPEDGSGKCADAIVDGITMEFKKVGNNRGTIGREFKKALKQATDVFIMTSNITRGAVYSKLVGEVKTLLLHGTSKPLNPSSNIYLWIESENMLVYYSMSNIIADAQK